MISQIIVYPLEQFLQLSNAKIEQLSFYVNNNIVLNQPQHDIENTIYTWGQEQQNYKLKYHYQPSDNFVVINLDSLPWNWKFYTDAIMEHLNDLADYSDNIDLTEFKEAEAALYARYKWIKYFHFDFGGESYEGDVSIVEGGGIVKSFRLER